MKKNESKNVMESKVMEEVDDNKKEFYDKWWEEETYNGILRLFSDLPEDHWLKPFLLDVAIKISSREDIDKYKEKWEEFRKSL